jgi:hypothetical protein
MKSLTTLPLSFFTTLHRQKHDAYGLPGQLLFSISVAGLPSQQQPYLRLCSLGHLGSNGAIEG